MKKRLFYLAGIISLLVATITFTAVQAEDPKVVKANQLTKAIATLLKINPDVAMVSG